MIVATQAFTPEAWKFFLPVALVALSFGAVCLDIDGLMEDLKGLLVAALAIGGCIASFRGILTDWDYSIRLYCGFWLFLNVLLVVTGFAIILDVGTPKHPKVNRWR